MRKLVCASRAFTLIEVLVVVAIIGIISGLSVFGIKDARANARDSVRKSNMELVASALELYKLDCNKYPDVLPSPGQPLTGKNPSGRCKTSNVYIASMPADPQGPSRYYNYYSPSNNKSYELCSSLEKSTGNTVTCGGSSVCGSQITQIQPGFGKVEILAQATPPVIRIRVNQASNRSCDQICQAEGLSCAGAGSTYSVGAVKLDAQYNNYSGGICKSQFFANCSTAMANTNYLDKNWPGLTCNWTWCDCSGARPVSDCYQKPEGATCYVPLDPDCLVHDPHNISRNCATGVGSCNHFECAGNYTTFQKCKTDSNCSSDQYCGGNSGIGFRCAPKVSGGYTCFRDAQCQSGACNNYVCTSPTPTPTPTPTLPSTPTPTATPNWGTGTPTPAVPVCNYKVTSP